MPRHPRKKQRAEQDPDLEPLGANHEFDLSATKDAEELRLESFLFGSSTDLPIPATEESSFADDLFVDDGQESANVPPQTVAWQDEDDANLEVSLASNKRRRKLRDTLAEDSIDGHEYEKRLRRQFEKINPTPDWAAAARKRMNDSAPAKRRRLYSDSEDEEDKTSGLGDLLAGTSSVLSRPSAKVLSHGTLAIERLRDANLSAPAEGEIKAVRFHPSPQVPLLLTTSSDRRLRLFNVDGHTNPHLHTAHIPSLPLTNAMFHPNGMSILLTGPRPFYYTYDLQTGATHRSPRGLLGTTFAGSNPAAQDGSMEVCSFDSSGSVLAVAGRRGHVHLVDWRAGGGQVVGDVKMNTGVKSLWWSDRKLFTLGEDAQVYVWDVGQRRCIRRWRDDGGYGSVILEGDRSGKYLAIGSKVGFVNIYGPDAASGGADRPKALKMLGNLTTSISTVRFNHDAQLLAVASSVKKDQMRMIHLPSLTAFSNWPTSSTPLGHVTSVDFSSDSEFVAIGNSRGRALLYHLRDFSSL